MITVTKTQLEGVLMIQPDVFEDFRGQYIETYNEELYQQHEINVKFIQDDISVSSQHVLRGLHGDEKTWKLVSCLYGTFYFVVVNVDKNSPDFGKWQSFTLSDKNRLQILVPPKHANGHLVLSKSAIFSYKQSENYDRASQFSYKWNDPAFNIWWPIKNPILSQRDQ